MNKEMVKRTLLSTIAPSVTGIMIQVLFKITNLHYFGDSWFAIILRLLIYLLITYVAVSLVVLLLEWVKAKLKKQA